MSILKNSEQQCHDTHAFKNNYRANQEMECVNLEENVTQFLGLFHFTIIFKQVNTKTNSRNVINITSKTTTSVKLEAQYSHNIHTIPTQHLHNIYTIFLQHLHFSDGTV